MSNNEPSKEENENRQNGSSAGGEVSLMQKAELYMGPLPAPDAFKQYEEALKGAANRILTMAEKEQSHQHKIREDRLSGTIKDAGDRRKIETRGQWFAITFGLALVAAGFYLALIGYKTVPSIIFSSTIVGVTAVFITKGKSILKTNSRNEINSHVTHS